MAPSQPPTQLATVAAISSLSSAASPAVRSRRRAQTCAEDRPSMTWNCARRPVALHREAALDQIVGAERHRRRTQLGAGVDRIGRAPRGDRDVAEAREVGGQVVGQRVREPPPARIVAEDVGPQHRHGDAPPAAGAARRARHRALERDVADQAEAAAPHGLDVARALRIVAERRPEVEDVFPHQVGRDPKSAPDLRQQRLARHHLALAPQQAPEHGRGPRRKPHRAVAAHQPEVVLQIPPRNQGDIPLGAPPARCRKSTRPQR